MLGSRLFRRKTQISPAFCVPDGIRVYAIGDIHGRLDLLNDLLAQIYEDDAGRRQAKTHFVLLGDLIDRGPDSAGVVARIHALRDAKERLHIIKGNHEEMFCATARGSTKAARLLLQVGGYQALESYGITRQAADRGTFQDLAALIHNHVPLADLDLMNAAVPYHRFGDYLFVHAGVRPGVPLGDQDEFDMRWIREPFLSVVRNDGLMVVHGHTPVDAAEQHVDRINVDTGAFSSGRLTAIGLEADARWFLETLGPAKTVA